MHSCYLECASKPVMKDLSNLVTPEHAAKWRAIGKLLGLTKGTLDIIDYDHHRSEACCNEMWGRWLDTKIDASWGTVISAIDIVNTVVDSEVLSIVKGKCIKKRSEVSQDDWPPYQPKTYITVVYLFITMKKLPMKKLLLLLQMKCIME